MNILQLLTPKRKLGNRGEHDACRYLKAHGYKILRRNFVADGGEIDIVAECKEATVFVEVKTRTKTVTGQYESRPAAAVTPQKQKKLLHTAKFFPRNYEKRMRFDVIEVVYSEENPKSKPEITHMISAFNYESAYRRQK